MASDYKKINIIFRVAHNYYLPTKPLYPKCYVLQSARISDVHLLFRISQPHTKHMGSLKPKHPSSPDPDWQVALKCRH